jgi:hypothetical protein
MSTNIDLGYLLEVVTRGFPTAVPPPPSWALWSKGAMHLIKKWGERAWLWSIYINYVNSAVDTCLFFPCLFSHFVCVETRILILNFRLWTNTIQLLELFQLWPLGALWAGSVAFWHVFHKRGSSVVLALTFWYNTMCQSYPVFPASVWKSASCLFIWKWIRNQGLRAASVPAAVGWHYFLALSEGRVTKDICANTYL